MLLAQRKKRQQVAGKIGHSDEEYELGAQQHVVAQQGNRARRFPERRPDVNPISWQTLPSQPSQSPTPPPYQPMQQKELQMLPSVPLNVPSMNLLPLEGNNKYNGNALFSKPLNFPSALPSLHATPCLYGPTVVNEPLPRIPSAPEPMTFASVLPSVTGAYNAVPCVQQTLPPMLPVSPPVLPPVLKRSPSRAVFSSRDQQYDLNTNFRSQFDKENISRRPTSQSTMGCITAYPQAKDDEIIARNRERQKAIEIQNENARLCEERRLQKEREKQLEIAEQRQQEEAERRERQRLAMERERQELGEFMGGGNKGDLSSKSRAAQLQEDLKKQIKENRRRKDEEERFTAIEIKGMERATSESPPCRNSGEVDPPIVATEKTEPEKVPSPVEPLTNGTAGNMSAPLFQAPPSFSFGPSMYDPSRAVGAFSMMPNFSVPSVTPISVPNVETKAEHTNAPSAEDMPMWSAPNPPTQCKTSPTSDAARYESQLHEMVNHHRNIQRMLEMEVQRRPGDMVPPPLPAVTTALPSAVPFSSAFAQGQVGLPNPFVAHPGRNAAGGHGSISNDNNIGGSSTASGAFSSVAAPGILKKSSEPSSRITVLGVSPPSHSAGAVSIGAVAAPFVVKADPEELSAEPSFFVTALP
ncbi:hypothetical protein MOQ_001704 [Trypanosoma cruzi marinkellei]|uniref:Uncharacterized protein n=1 Tax=Trypanosoma cruzi marinkellei TaxID=85056 RepID=K2NSZ0_TRYCR|nr:hypothetical protein MOQ_001704 [Trypanosoma cruzi marinkellei]